MAALIATLASSGVGGIIIGDILGLLAERSGILGFGGKVAKSLIEKRKREKLVRQAEKDGLTDMLSAAGAKRK